MYEDEIIVKSEFLILYVKSFGEGNTFSMRLTTVEALSTSLISVTPSWRLYSTPTVNKNVVGTPCCRHDQHFHPVTSN